MASKYKQIGVVRSLRELNRLNVSFYDAALGSVRLDPASVRRRNMAIEWAQEHQDEYASIRSLAAAASTKYGIQVDLILNSLLSSEGTKDSLDPNELTFSPGAGMVHEGLGAAKAKDSSVIARWETKGGKYFVVLTREDDGAYTYSARGAGGVLGKLPDDQAAISKMERDLEYHLPDNSKTGFTRVK